ncbi:MAG: low affinity iron permease family protein [Betaproteobacteria bacterium]
MNTTTRVSTIFTRIAKGTARLTGRPLTFSIAVFLVIAWAVSGPYFQYSDTWQLTINTGTTIVTFLMVFLIQATQNRDAEAIQIKLDEVIRSLHGAHNALLDLEELEEDDLMKVRENYLALAEQARQRLKRGKDDTGVPEINHDHAEVAKQVPAGQRRAR